MHAAAKRSLVASAPALAAERLRIQGELLEIADQIRDFEDQLEDLAPGDQRNAVLASHRATISHSDSLEARERLLSARLDRAERTRRELAAMGVVVTEAPEEDRWVVVQRALGACNRALLALAFVHDAQAVCDRFSNREPLRRTLFETLHRARPRVEDLVDAATDLVKLYPRTIELFDLERMERLLAPPSEDIENTPLGRAVFWLTRRLQILLQALLAEEAALERDGE